MTLILLTFFAALFLESIGTIVSIQGLTLLFGVEPLIIALAVALDFGKLVGVTVLYKEWKQLPRLLKLYLIAAAVVLTSITSAGGIGYLSASSQKALLPTKSLQVKVDALNQEKQKLELRKKEIDTQITNLPTDMVKGRTKLLNGFKEELAHVNNRIIALDQELPQAQVELIDKSSHAGPITYIAEAIGMTAEQTMSLIIAPIIFVFDPLAIALILVGNYLVEKRQHTQDIIDHPTFAEIIAPQEVEVGELAKVELIDDLALKDLERRKTALKDSGILDEEWNHNFINLSNEAAHPVSIEEEIEINNLDETINPYFHADQIELAKQVAEEAAEPVHRSSLEDFSQHLVGAEVTRDDNGLSVNMKKVYR